MSEPEFENARALIGLLAHVKTHCMPDRESNVGMCYMPDRPSDLGIMSIPIGADCPSNMGFNQPDWYSNVGTLTTWSAGTPRFLNALGLEGVEHDPYIGSDICSALPQRGANVPPPAPSVSVRGLSALALDVSVYLVSATFRSTHARR